MSNKGNKYLPRPITPGLFVFALIFGVLVSALQSSAQSVYGTYPSRSYLPNEYKSNQFSTSPQNWGIAQDARGLMYICNTSGILEFDGISWNLVPGTENLKMLKAVSGPDGRVYTGGVGEIGYLGPGKLHGVQFHSLNHLIQDTALNFGTAFMIKAIGDSVAFLCPSHLFIYHNDSISTYTSNDGFMRILDHYGRLFLQMVDGELIELKDGTMMSLMDERLPPEIVVSQVFGPRDAPMLACNRGGVLQIKDRSLRPVQTILDDLSLWNGDRLNSEATAFASTERGAVVLDDQGRLQGIFQTPYDLSNDVVISPYFDNYGQLWLATSNGIRHIEYPGRITYFDESNGLKGIPLCIDISDNGVLLGTTSGLYVLKEESGQFERLTLDQQFRAEEFVTDILNVGGDKMILTSHGLFQMEGQRFIRISEIGGFDLEIEDETGTSLVYGGEFGLALLSKADGRWSVVNTIDTVVHDILSVTSQQGKTIWASMFSISKVDISGSEIRVTTLDSIHGFVQEMGPIWTFEHGDTAYFCTSIGLYAWNDSLERMEPSGFFGERFVSGAVSQPSVAGDSSLWLHHEEAIGSVDLNTGEFRHQDLNRLEFSDVWSIYPTPGGQVWILTTEAVYRLDPSVDASYQGGFNVLIREVRTEEDSVLFGGFFSNPAGAPSIFQSDSMRPVLDYSHNQLSIRFSATYYSATDKIMYSTLLEGQDENWSQWSAQPFRDYMNLREGNFIFKVKARNVFGEESPVAAYAFTVEPPIYRTSWAYLLYIIGAGLVLWAVAVLYSWRLRQQKTRLEGVVRDRTREIAEEKQKSDSLLLNILPEETATELKDKGFATTKSYDKVSVMFSDFVSFTAISEFLSPEDLVSEIDFCFSAFDDIVDQEGLEKIKTIGDAYMCASGLNPDVSDPEVRIVRAGLAIRDFMAAHNAERKRQGLPFFEVRIGIHTGPVVAGVVGKKKFAYDIWGDTVNTAARMESSSEPGNINISAVTYAYVKDHYACDSRGKIQAKNKGMLEMYFIRDVLAGTEAAVETQ